jgi:hypothetical protein
MILVSLHHNFGLTEHFFMDLMQSNVPHSQIQHTQNYQYIENYSISKRWFVVIRDCLVSDNASGLLGIHWRTVGISPQIGALAYFPWNTQLTSHEFWLLFFINHKKCLFDQLIFLLSLSLSLSHIAFFVFLVRLDFATAWFGPEIASDAVVILDSIDSFKMPRYKNLTQQNLNSDFHSAIEFIHFFVQTSRMEKWTRFFCSYH